MSRRRKIVRGDVSMVVGIAKGRGVERLMAESVAPQLRRRRSLIRCALALSPYLGEPVPAGVGALLEALGDLDRSLLAMLRTTEAYLAGTGGFVEAECEAQLSLCMKADARVERALATLAGATSSPGHA
jgi:hypothetical protein